MSEESERVVGQQIFDRAVDEAASEIAKTDPEAAKQMIEELRGKDPDETMEALEEMLGDEQKADPQYIGPMTPDDVPVGTRCLVRHGLPPRPVEVIVEEWSRGNRVKLKFAGGQSLWVEAPPKVVEILTDVE